MEIPNSKLFRYAILLLIPTLILAGCTQISSKPQSTPYTTALPTTPQIPTQIKNPSTQTPTPIIPSVNLSISTSNPGIEGTKSVTITPDQKIYMAWTSTGTTSCSIIDTNTKAGLNENENYAPTSSSWHIIGNGYVFYGVTTYTITCTSPNGNVQDSVQANYPQRPIQTIYATPSPTSEIPATTPAPTPISTNEYHAYFYAGTQITLNNGMNMKVSNISPTSTNEPQIITLEISNSAGVLTDVDNLQEGQTYNASGNYITASSIAANGNFQPFAYLSITTYNPSTTPTATSSPTPSPTSSPTPTATPTPFPVSASVNLSISSSYPVILGTKSITINSTQVSEGVTNSFLAWNSTGTTSCTLSITNNAGGGNTSLSVPTSSALQPAGFGPVFNGITTYIISCASTSGTVEDSTQAFLQP